MNNHKIFKGEPYVTSPFMKRHAILHIINY